VACRRSGAQRAAFWLSNFLPPDERDGVRAIAAGCRLIVHTIAANARPQADGCCSGTGDVAELIQARIDAMYADRLELPRPEFRDESQHILAAIAETSL